MADVEDISTDTMRTTSGRPAALVRQATQTLQTTAAGTKPPHIVLMAIDDLGWTDVGYHGLPHSTPSRVGRR